jgi:hypothetical protein
MSAKETMTSFFEDTRKHFSDYLDMRLEIYRLRLIRMLSKTAGYLIWVIVLLVLASLFIIFSGLTMGFWLSTVTGSYAKGFGLTTIFIATGIFLLYISRKALFVNPIVRNMIKHSTKEKQTTDN